MKRFVKCFSQFIDAKQDFSREKPHAVNMGRVDKVKVRKCKVQRLCVLHFHFAVSGGCFFLMKLYH